MANKERQSNLQMKQCMKILEQQFNSDKILYIFWNHWIIWIIFLFFLLLQQVLSELNYQKIVSLLRHIMVIVKYWSLKFSIKLADVHNWIKKNALSNRQRWKIWFLLLQESEDEKTWMIDQVLKKYFVSE